MPIPRHVLIPVALAVFFRRAWDTDSSTDPLGDDGFSARLALSDSRRLGSPCGDTGDALAFRAATNLWKTQAICTPFFAARHHLRSLFLCKLWTDWGQRAFWENESSSMWPCRQTQV